MLLHVVNQRRGLDDCFSLSHDDADRVVVSNFADVV